MLALYHLGYRKKVTEKLAALLTEQVNPHTANIDALSTLDMLRVINDEDKQVALAVEAALPQIATAIDAIVDRLSHGGRLFYTGAGTSGRLGVLDASECPPTYNVSPDLIQGFIAGGDGALRKAVEGAEDSRELGASDIASYSFGPLDALCGIAASGRTPYVLGAIAKAKELGGLTLGLSCSPRSALSAAVDLPIEILTGPEVVTGSTRMKAGTGTKLALNMISTGAMIRLGYVYGNLMVNLQPTNEKLVDRALRIITTAAQVTRDEAAQALTASGSNVRTAIVMAKLGISKELAEQRITAAHGRIRQVLESA